MKKYILFFKMHTKSMKKKKSPENVLFLRNMDPDLF